MTILHRELSYRIVGCAMEVHREIGPGLAEDFYHRALHSRLLSTGIPSEYKPTRRLIHKGTLADEFEADLIADGSIVIELKSLDGEFAPAHYTQLISYLKCWGLKLGLLFDFGKESLIQRRVAYTERPAQLNAVSPESKKPSAPTDAELLSRILSSLRDIAATHGLGYRDTTYRGILLADLTAESIGFEQRQADIWCDGANLGPTQLSSFVVDGRCVVKVLALFDHLHAMHRAVLQTELKHLRLPWGVLVNFGKKSLDWRFVENNSRAS